MRSLYELYRDLVQWLARNGFIRVVEKEPWTPANSTGVAGEEIAAEHLRRLGYEIIATNFKRTWGEIDIIALDRDVIVYVEVKSRKSLSSSPELAVTKEKRSQMIRVAKSFASQHKLLHHASRFDIIAVRAPESEEPQIDHFKNAFRNDEPDTAFTRYH